MTAEVIKFQQPPRRDPLLKPQEVMQHPDVVGKIGLDQARAICRMYGIRPSGKQGGHLFIRQSVLETYLTNPNALVKNTEMNTPRHKSNPYRRGSRMGGRT